jgi:hypothetical protein
MGEKQTPSVQHALKSAYLGFPGMRGSASLVPLVLQGVFLCCSWSRFPGGPGGGSGRLFSWEIEGLRPVPARIRGGLMFSFLFQPKTQLGSGRGAANIETMKGRYRPLAGNSGRVWFGFGCLLVLVAGKHRPTPTQNQIRLRTSVRGQRPHESRPSVSLRVRSRSEAGRSGFYALLGDARTPKPGIKS